MPSINLRAKKGGRNMAPVSRKQKLHSVGRLLGYIIKFYPWQFALVLSCVIISSSTGAIGAYIIGNVIVDSYINPAVKSGFSLDAFAPSTGLFAGSPFSTCLIVLVVVYILGLATTYLYNVLMSIVGQGVQKKIRDELFDHMETLPISYFDRRGHGDIMSIYTNDVDALREMLSRALPMVASSLMTMVACLVMMTVTDLLLTSVVVLFSLLILLISGFYAKKSSHYFVKQQIELGATNSYIEEMINGQKVVKVFNYESRNIAGFQKHNQDLFTYSVKANRFANVLMPTVNQLSNIQYAILALLGGIAAVSGFTGYSLTGAHILDVGIIISFLMYSKSFTQPIGQVSQQLNLIALALAGSTRIFEVMDEPSENDDGYVELVNAKPDQDGNPIECQERTGQWAWRHFHKDGSPITFVWLKGKITFQDVNFSYIPGKTVLHDVSLFAKPGQKIAFVGPTGAGKTTITNLINRFYDIEDGKIRFDDINITKIKKTDLRRSLGMVLQDTKLFTGTVRENIRFGKLDATDEEVEKAAKLANADGFIRNLPNGYDTVLESGGASLSQGQRQLLSIARCAVADPPVMILDEATSSIDSRTEKLVQEGMDAIMTGRTVFVIAHRLSTIQNANVIMVLKNGSIIERGTHQQLLAEQGEYYQLYTGGKATD